jgi:hypothetical protein
MPNPTRSNDPIHSLNHCMPIANRVRLGDLLESLAINHNALIAAINAAGVAGLAISTTLDVTPPSQS